MNNLADALQYVHNTNGGASLENFIEDAEPIGNHLWRQLTAAGYVTVNQNTQKIYLTEAGEAARAKL